MEKYQNNIIKKTGFQKYLLNEILLKNINEIGYKKPTSIQKLAIPEILNNNNIIIKSETGSGKTSAFVIPLIEKLLLNTNTNFKKSNNLRALVISPTRELAKQILEIFIILSKNLNLKFGILFGGENIEKQFENLECQPNVIIATPGRLIQHIKEGSININNIEYLIIDEVDKLFEQGFEFQIKTIMQYGHIKKQYILLSATIPNNLSSFIKKDINDYKIISLTTEYNLPNSINLNIIYCREDEKIKALLCILFFSSISKEKIMIFCPTKFHCDYISQCLWNFKINNTLLFGKMDQKIRDHNLSKFKNNETNIIIVTDLAARGLDIAKIDTVINFDFPDNTKLFIHRSGRTGRIGQLGNVISIVSSIDVPFLIEISENIKRKLEFNIIEDNKNNYILLSKISKELLNELDLYIQNQLFSKDFDQKELEESLINSYLKKNKYKLKPNQKYVEKGKEIIQNLNNLKQSKIFDNISNIYSLNQKHTNLINQLTEYRPTNSIILKNNKIDLRNKFSKTTNQTFKKKFHKSIIEKKQNIFDNKIKKSQKKNFINTNQYINSNKNIEESKRLWGDDEPQNLDEITLNLIPDDNYNKSNQSKSNNNNKSSVHMNSKNKINNSYKKWLSRKNNFKQKNLNNEIKSMNELIKGKKIKNNKQNIKFQEKKKMKERIIRNKLHKNRKNLIIIKNK